MFKSTDYVAQFSHGRVSAGSDNFSSESAAISGTLAMLFESGFEEVSASIHHRGNCLWRFHRIAFNQVLLTRSISNERSHQFQYHLSQLLRSNTMSEDHDDINERVDVLNGLTTFLDDECVTATELIEIVNQLPTVLRRIRDDTGSKGDHMSDPKHTLTPYHIDKLVAVNGAPIIVAPTCWMGSKRVIAIVIHHYGSEDPEVKPNAEFIVRACNAHYKLVEALEALLSANVYADAEGLVPVYNADEEIVNVARAALAAAKESK